MSQRSVLTAIAPEPPTLVFKYVLSSGLQLAGHAHQQAPGTQGKPVSGSPLLLKNMGSGDRMHAFLLMWRALYQLCRLPSHIYVHFSCLRCHLPPEHHDLSIVQLVWQILKDTLSHS